MSTIFKFIKISFIYYFLSNCFCCCNKITNSSITPAIIAKITVITDHVLPVILHESSGLCYTNGNLWTFGDSGNPNQIFKIDSINCAIIQSVTVQNFINVDWEDITADSLYIYIGDFGNNNGDRKNLKVLRIKKSDLYSNLPTLNINADAINFSYTDQTNFASNSNTNFDCEALVSVYDNLYLFSKDRGDLKTRCYKLSKTPGTYAIAPISTFNTNGKISSAAFNPDTKELALGGYMSEKEFPFIWFFKGYAADNFFDGEKIKVSLTANSTPWQTEGLDYSAANSMFLSCESTPQIAASLFTLKLNLKY